jgi:hypothetical protein
MAVAVMFAPTSMSLSQYDECIKQLERAGAGAPPGRLYHVCQVVDGRPQVFDVWDSMESFERFGQTLMPIAERLGFDPGQPVSNEVHNVIKG